MKKYHIYITDQFTYDDEIQRNSDKEIFKKALISKDFKLIDRKNNIYPVNPNKLEWLNNRMEWMLDSINLDNKVIYFSSSEDINTKAYKNFIIKQVDDDKVDDKVVDNKVKINIDDKVIFDYYTYPFNDTRTKVTPQLNILTGIVTEIGHDHYVVRIQDKNYPDITNENISNLNSDKTMEIEYKQIKTVCKNTHNIYLGGGARRKSSRKNHNKKKTIRHRRKSVRHNRRRR